MLFKVIPNLVCKRSLKRALISIQLQECAGISIRLRLRITNTPVLQRSQRENMHCNALSMHRYIIESDGQSCIKIIKISLVSGHCQSCTKSYNRVSIKKFKRKWQLEPIN